MFLDIDSYPFPTSGDTDTRTRRGLTGTYFSAGVSARHVPVSLRKLLREPEVYEEET